MPRLLGRKYTTMKNIKMARAKCVLLIIVPAQCILEKKIIRERIDIFGSVASDLIPERVEKECMLLKLPLVQQKHEGGNMYFVMWESKIKGQSYVGRCFLNDKSLRIVAGEGTLRRLIYSLTEGPQAQRTFLVLRNPWKVTALIVSTISCMRFLRPITGLLHGSEENSHSLREWSSLPFLLLWMIMDRLDFFSNANIALVCRHWWHGSRNNPTKMHGIPWIMLNPSAKGNTNTCAREFINFDRSKKFVVELPEFYMSDPLFSRRGWILFRRNNLCTEDQIVDSLFLINPLTKGKIEVGDLVIDREGSIIRSTEGCFSTSQDGFPNCVVMCYKHSEDKISLYITYLGGDQVWTKQSYVAKGFRVTNCGMTVINSHVYIFCKGGVMITYDMGGQTWKEIAPPLTELVYQRAPPLTDLVYPVYPPLKFMEHEGHVGLFGYYKERCLFKYCHTHNCWQRLANDDEANNNLSIFGSENCTYLTVRIQSGLNVHSIRPHDDGNSYWILTTDYLLGEITGFKLHDTGAYWVYIG